MGDLALDQLDDAPAQGQRRQRQLGEGARLGIAGHVVEGGDRIGGQLGIAGEVGEIGIEACRNRMIVAGPEMDIAAHALGLAPDDEGDLGVASEVKPKTT
jgi:hypothetical protein